MFYLYTNVQPMESATKIQLETKSTYDDVAIRVSGLSKRYLIGGEKKGSLAETLSGMIGAKSKQKEEFWALKDINFEVKKGEVIGIIGKNGAGKSTLLKILSRITQPTTGKIDINGRVASLLEVGTGFHPELTGRENIYLNGTILGMSRQEVKDKFEEIVEFSGVHKFIDTPVKHYSSGMYVRLAFSVAAHLEPEILIIDEVLAVGDIEFQQKCLGKMKEVADFGRTVLFVSHNMSAVQNLCSSAMLLKNGHTIALGNTNEIIDIYLKRSNHIEELSFPFNLNHSFSLESFMTYRETNIGEFQSAILGAPYNLSVTIKNHNTERRKINVRLQIFDEKKNLMTTLNTRHLNAMAWVEPLEQATFNCKIEKFNLGDRNFILGIKVVDEDNNILLDDEEFMSFESEFGDFHGNGKLPSKDNIGIVVTEHSWDIS